MYKSSEHLAITETLCFLRNMGTQSNTVFRIPDTLTYWPWPCIINPHHEEVKARPKPGFAPSKHLGQNLNGKRSASYCLSPPID